MEWPMKKRPSGPFVHEHTNEWFCLCDQFHCQHIWYPFALLQQYAIGQAAAIQVDFTPSSPLSSNVEFSVEQFFFSLLLFVIVIKTMSGPHILCTTKYLYIYLLRTSVGTKKKVAFLAYSHSGAWTHIAHTGFYHDLYLSCATFEHEGERGDTQNVLPHMPNVARPRKTKWPANIFG